MWETNRVNSGKGSFLYSKWKYNIVSVPKYKYLAQRWLLVRGWAWAEPSANLARQGTISLPKNKYLTSKLCQTGIIPGAGCWPGCWAAPHLKHKVGLWSEAELKLSLGWASANSAIQGRLSGLQAKQEVTVAKTKVLGMTKRAILLEDCYLFSRPGQSQWLLYK